MSQPIPWDVLQEWVSYIKEYGDLCRDLRDWLERVNRYSDLRDEVQPKEEREIKAQFAASEPQWEDLNQRWQAFLERHPEVAARLAEGGQA